MDNRNESSPRGISSEELDRILSNVKNRNIFQKIFDFFLNLTYQYGELREIRAREKLTRELKQIFIQKINEFSDAVDNNPDWSTAIDMNYPGPFFIAYYKLHHKHGAMLSYEFSYIRKNLEKKKSSLFLKGVMAVVREVPIDKPIPYLGNKLEIPNRVTY